MSIYQITKKEPYKQDALYLQNISGKNHNCIFNCILYRLQELGKLGKLTNCNNLEACAQELRDIVAQYYKDNQFKNSEFNISQLDRMNQDQWVKHISTFGKYADTHYTLKALAEKLDIEIYIFSQNANTDASQSRYKIKKYGNSKDQLFIFYANKHVQIVKGVDKKVFENIIQDIDFCKVDGVLKEEPNVCKDLISDDSFDSFKMAGQDLADSCSALIAG
jgi:hypothetical protein